ncbi:Non-specific lipid-transfer protein 2 [Linum perenne]
MQNDVIFKAHATVGCDYVKEHVKPCVNYVMKVAPEVSSDCCKGLKKLVRNATSTEDKKDVCGCFGQMFKPVRFLDDGRLDDVVRVCNVKVPFKLSKNPDCSK